MSFDLEKQQRRELLNFVIEKTERFYAATKGFDLSPELNIEKIVKFIEDANLDSGQLPNEAIDHVIKGLETYSVHTPHPKYFGLFNPRANYAGIMADLITAYYNPQLAAWSHAPFAVEVERKLIKLFALKFGYKNSIDGVFTTGGAEANLTAVLCSLNNKYPNFAKEGIFGLNKKPVIFCSKEAHHSIQKAAKTVGLGYKLVKSIPVNENLKLNLRQLKEEIDRLDHTKYEPLMVIGTAGTTGTGTIDALDKLAVFCNNENIWFHVDAAYGGGAILSSKLKKVLTGIEKSDSITFDAHKWMSTPMGTSIFLTSKSDILNKTFRITTEYMPKEANKLDIVEPFQHSIQWSRRFIGLKVYLSLLFYGWKGYEQAINHQAEMGQFLRKHLTKSGWVVKNDTRLPVVCFSDIEFEKEHDFYSTILERIIKNGKSWLSIYPINGNPTFRACITNYNTSKEDVLELVEELNMERANYKK